MSPGWIGGTCLVSDVRSNGAETPMLKAKAGFNWTSPARWCITTKRAPTSAIAKVTTQYSQLFA